MAALKNARHEKYVQNLIAGMSQRQAYRDAFPSSKRWKDETIDNNASKLLKENEVLTRYQELQEEQKNDALLTRWEKRKLLADIARDEEVSVADREKAIDLDNKMEGEYISKIEMDATAQVVIADDIPDES